MPALPPSPSPADSMDHGLRALATLLEAMPPDVDAEGLPTELMALVDYLRPRPTDITAALLAPGPTGPESGQGPGRFQRALEHTAGAVARVEELAALLAGQPRLARQLSTHLAALCEGRRQRHLLSEKGIPEQEGLFNGVSRRLRGHFWPRRRDRLYWDDLFGEVFSSSSDADWVEAVPRPTWSRIFLSLSLPDQGCSDGAGRTPPEPPTPGLRQLRFEAGAAVAMVSHRLAALGIEPVLRRYYAPSAQNESPFLAQAHEIALWTASLDLDRPVEDGGAHLKHGLVLLDQCSDILKEIRKLANTQGTSIRLTRVVLRGNALIVRLNQLLKLLGPFDADARAEAFADLFADLVDGESDSQGVLRFVRESTDLIALQITEHAARTGEHYVTSTRAEYWRMARSAAGAGLIVAVMSLIKIMITAWGLPVFWEAFFSGTNYAAGFVLIHLLGLTLATKQPAMTAAKIASTIEPSRGGTASLERLAELTASVSRTQFVAIVGNVAVAVPVSFGIAVLFPALFGTDVVGPEKAADLLESVHPWHSLALLYAAVAGLCLFVAGLVSGYFDNRCLYKRLPELLRESPRLLRVFGPKRADQIATYVSSNFGALIGNTALGFLLAFVGFFGEILGLPLDVRHVTLSSAYVAYGTVGLGSAVDVGLVAAASLGVVLVAFTNLTVSFGLALNLAMRAREVRFSSNLRIADAVRRRLAARPLSFIFPARTPPPVPETESDSDSKSDSRSG